MLRTDDTTYSIAVREPAERNLANDRVREVLAEELGVPVKRIQIISGHRSPKKIFSVG